MGRLLHKATEASRLLDALEQMIVNDAEDGALSEGLGRLKDEASERLALLAREVRDGTFAPAPLLELSIPKSNGGVRKLGLPRPIERVLERSMLDVLWPSLDPMLGSSSYGYRPGLGVGDAVREIVRLRELGFDWVVRVDVDDCFPSISRVRLRRLLALTVPDVAMRALIDKLLERPVRIGGRLTYPTVGIPQGSPLSPLFANLYLAALDEAVRAAGYPLVRFADDIVILARTEQGARMALETAEEAADDIDLRLGTDKSEVLDFSTGFCFLGEDINHRYPATTGTTGLAEPDRKTLYAGVQGAYASIRNGRVIVSKDKVELLSVPSGHVGRIVVFGGVTLSPGIRSWALNNDVDFVLCSRRGEFQGWLAGANQGPTALRRAQFHATDQPDLCLQVGRAIERGKLHNQRVLLQRALEPENADDLKEPIAQLDAFTDSLPSAQTRDELLGVEGMAARVYFGALGHLVPDALEFDGRERRPPGDVVNAALGYGYAILLGETTTACAAAGLDPAVGFLHTDRGQRPSLALDLMEEFRPLLIDSAVLALVRSGAIGVAQGRRVEHGKGGVLLTEEGRRRLIAEVERRLLTETYHVPSRRKTSYRRIIHLQAQQLANVVRTRHCAYQPMLRRV